MSYPYDDPYSDRSWANTVQRYLAVAVAGAILFLGSVVCGIGFLWSTISDAQRSAALHQEAERRLADQEVARKQAEADRVKRLGVAIDTSVAGLRACAIDDSQALDRAWVALYQAIASAKSAGVNPPAEVIDATRDLNAIYEKVLTARKLITEGQAIPVPDEAQPPKYEEPEYDGAWFLSGYYRANYTGRNGDIEGVVITKGESYFVVMGADPASRGVDYLRGYVESTGKIIDLAVGRGGRTAVVVRLSDEETYRDDQKAYRAVVAEAKAKHQQALAAYRNAIQERKDTIRKLAAALDAAKQEESRLLGLYPAALKEAAERLRRDGGRAPVEGANSPTAASPRPGPATSSARENGEPAAGAPPQSGPPDSEIATFPVSFASVPLGAQVFVDGEQIGNTPIRGFSVKAGAHVIRMVLEDKTGTQTLSVGPDGPSRCVWRSAEGSWESGS